MSTVDVPRDGVDVDLPDHPPEPAELRRLVTSTLVGTDAGRLVDLLSVTWQLVANAYRHASAPRRLRLFRSHEPGVVRVEVEDASPSRLPVLGRPDTPALGRGLLVVNRLSTRWGHRPDGDRKTVWAEVRPA